MTNRKKIGSLPCLSGVINYTEISKAMFKSERGVIWSWGSLRFLMLDLLGGRWDFSDVSPS